MTKKKTINPEDIALFKAAISGTRPLRQNKILLRKPSPPVRTDPSPDIEKEWINLNEDGEIPQVMSDDFLLYKHISISDKILRKLRKGQYNVEATLDLHGMIVIKAKSAVEQFIDTGLQMGCRVVLIIHGKGQENKAPVLKNKLNQWLRNIEPVLAFCSAQKHHGSRGAIYVLLKKAK